MANEIRRRYNFKSGRITDNPLSNSATTLNSAELAGLAAIGSTEHAVLVLDPTGVGNGPEIVYVTAHTGSATSATIVRGREGTSGVQHASTIYWVHVATVNDFAIVGTNSEEPSGSGVPYEGQLYVDTTDDEFEVYNGSAWAPFKYGAWTSWTPSVTQSATPAQTPGTCKYAKFGRLVVAYGAISFTGAGTAGNAIAMTLPATAAVATVIGSFWYFDAGTTNHAGTVRLTSTTSARFQYDGYGAEMGNGDFAIASGDSMSFVLMYEAAS